MTPDLLILISPDLEPWQRQALTPMVEEMQSQFEVRLMDITKKHRHYLKKPNLARTIWVVSKWWGRTMQFLAAKRCDSPVYFSVLGPPARNNLFTMFWIRKAFTPPPGIALLTHSPMNFRFYREIKQLSEEQVKYLSFPMVPFSSSSERKIKGKNDPVTIGTFAPFGSQSNLSYLLTVAHNVTHRFDQVKFKIFGQGNFGPHLRSIVDKLNLNSFVDIVETSDLSKIGELDIFLYSPLQNQDFVPMLAAGSFELPVISDEVAGVSEFIIDGKSGFIVPVHDTAAMSEAILMLCRDPKQRIDVGKNLNANLKRKYSIKAVSLEYKNLFFSAKGIDRLHAA